MRWVKLANLRRALEMIGFGSVIILSLDKLLY